MDDSPYMTDRKYHRLLKSHMANSNQRYKVLTQRMNRLEKIVLISSGSLFAGMLSVILTLLQKL